MRKKLVSLALALALCLGLAVPAMAANYTEVIPCKYDKVNSFSEGLAAVKLNNKWSFIDKAGKEVLPLKYDIVGILSEGLAAVAVESGKDEYGDSIYKWGYIDKTGKEVVPCKYDRAWAFFEGLAVVNVGYSERAFGYSGKYGFIDKTGKEVVPCKYDGVGDFSEGLAAVAVESGKDEYGLILYTWGYIDMTGKEVVPCKYGKAYSFSEGLAAVDMREKVEYGYIDKWGYIDKTGKEVVPCKYDEADSFSEGLAAVYGATGEKDEYDYDIYKWGYIDKTGKVVVPCKYDRAWAFFEGLAAVDMEIERHEYGNTIGIVDKWGYIDKTGKEVVPCKYGGGDVYTGIFSEGLAAVAMWNGEGDGYASDFRWGYIDKTGKEVVPCKYNDAWRFSEGLAAVCVGDPYDGGKWGFIAVSGTTAPEQPSGGPQVSDWAKEQVSKAAANGLVPDGLGNDYRVNITRAQFAATAVKLYEAMSGQKAPAAGASPFTDTGDAAVIQAEALGIVSGVGDGKFAPDALVTREQAAAMLSRVYTKLGGTIPEVAATTFADNDKVSGWARDAVAFMSANKIVSGVGSNQFNPKGNASIEQALAIALRMFDNLK